MFYLCRVISQFTTFDKPVKILAAALKLFVAYGFHGTPTSKIAQEAGVSNGTLFHYFKTKDELVVALYTSIKGGLSQYLAGKMEQAVTIKERSEALFIHSVAWALENPDAFYFIQQFHFSPHMSLIPEEVTQQQTKRHNQLLEEGLKAGIFKPFPPEMIASIYASQVNGMYHFLLGSNLSAVKKKKLIGEAFASVWLALTNPEEQWNKK